MSLLMDYRRQLQDEKRQRLQVEFQKAWNDGEQVCISRLQPRISQNDRQEPLYLRYLNSSLFLVPAGGMLQLHIGMKG